MLFVAVVVVGCWLLIVVLCERVGVAVVVGCLCSCVGLVLGIVVTDFSLFLVLVFSLLLMLHVVVDVVVVVLFAVGAIVADQIGAENRRLVLILLTYLPSLMCYAACNVLCCH